MTLLAAHIQALLDRAAPLLATTEAEAAAEAIRSRLDEPLRVAIAGRVKAGKSTLLNALVGERLAPTDAGECTKVVTWYRHGISYDVAAVTREGDRLPLPFDRDRDRLTIDSGDLDLNGVARLEVSWPAARLQHYTLIDTPGLEAHDEAGSARARRLLGVDDTDRSEVDAVVYLMRHAHRLDVEYLEAFTDRSVAHPSPVNAIAVLSRADEIGAGRPDALESAAAIAARYTADPRIRSLSATVVPVAGLIAETGRTLLESEGGSLRALAELPDQEVRRLVMSVDRFADPDRSTLDTETRRDLLLRLGLFGVRFGIDRLRRESVSTSDLARSLVAASGIDLLATLLDDHFARRAALLKGRSGIANLKVLIGGLPASSEADTLMAEIERIEAGAPELGELKLLHLVISGAAAFDLGETSEVDLLISDEPPAVRLGMPEDTGPEALQALIVERLDGWRRKAAHPLASAAQREASELVAAAYERMHEQLPQG